jgi:hypothetical protein
VQVGDASGEQLGERAGGIGLGCEDVVLIEGVDDQDQTPPAVTGGRCGAT